MATLAFDVFWRDHGASKGMHDLGTDAGKAHKETETLSSHVGKLGGALAGLVAIDVFSEFIRGARDAAAQTRITENVIRTTGGAAHVTAKDVEDLSLSISNKSGVDDDAVRSGANLLLTFTGIRNEVGKGNNIFDRATGSVIDLAAAMNGGKVTTDGVKAASIQLGKALNDPIKGMSALRRVGVSFTDQQQEQIKTLVKSGHTLEAQKIILDEVGKEFGGTAAAAADPMQKLQVIAENLGKQIGGALLPAVNDFASFMADTGAPAVASFVTVLTGIPAPVYAAAAGLAGLVGAIKVGTKATEAYHDAAKSVGEVIDFFAARAAAAAAAEAAQATAAEGVAAAETAHASASAKAAAATEAVGAASTGAAAAEGAEAVAADGAAVSTGRLGLAAQGAGAMLGGLAAKALLAGGIGGLAYLSAQISGWQGTAEVTTVKTNDLADALLHLSATAHAPKAALDAVTTSGERYWSSVETGTDVIKQFGAIAKGAFGDGLQDIIGRMQTGSERTDRFTQTATQLDAALTAMTKSGHAADAAAFLAKVKTEAGLSDDEWVHVTNHLPGYTAAIGGAGTATNITAGKTRDLAAAQEAAKAAADAHATALKNEIDRLTNATDAFLGARSAARAVRDAQDALTKAVHDNGRGLSDNTVKGRANAAALDAVAQATRTDLKAKIDAGMPMARFAAAVANSRSKLIAEATAAGMSKDAAKRYANQILAVPTKQITDYKALHLNEVIGKVSALHQGINSLSSKDLKIALQSTGDIPTRLQIYAALKGRKDGGYTGNAGVNDVAGFVHGQEFVVNARATARHLPLLEAINARGYKDGGLVGRHVNYTASTRGFWPSAALMSSYYGAIEQTIANAIGAKYAASAAAATGPAPGFLGAGGGNAGNMRLGQSLAASYGWTGQQWLALRSLWMGESGWNNLARNPSSGAFGIPQALPPGKMGAAAVAGSAYAQIIWGLRYIRDVYGSPASAWAKWNARSPHWYEGGGLARGAGIWAKGPKPERILSPRQTDVFERAMARAATGGRGGGGVQIDVHVHGSAQGFEDQLVTSVNRVARTGRLDRALRQIVNV